MTEEVTIFSLIQNCNLQKYKNMLISMRLNPFLEEGEDYGRPDLETNLLNISVMYGDSKLIDNEFFRLRPTYKTYQNLDKAYNIALTVERHDLLEYLNIERQSILQRQQSFRPVERPNSNMQPRELLNRELLNRAIGNDGAHL